MKAAILTMPGPVEQGPLSIEDVPMPVVEPGFALLGAGLWDMPH